MFKVRMQPHSMKVDQACMLLADKRPINLVKQRMDTLLLLLLEDNEDEAEAMGVAIAFKEETTILQKQVNDGKAWF